MKKIFLTILTICSFYNISAQVDRSIGIGQYKNNVKPDTKIEDIINQSVAKFKEKLNLDGFQEAVAQNLVRSNYTKSKEIIESTLYSNEEKRDLIIKQGDNFNLEIKKVLSKEQAEKYEKMIAEKK
ncbi:hypothetical protein [Flavobacterium psychraquaticum]|uniref:hypothetical protein n=1 Tax=Flavobacterium psychraquaticum TaxID=3103958 RepID=UPI002ACD8A0A|nr:hypothetical protein [Flavobacterium sp. LB-N7T]